MQWHFRQNHNIMRFYYGLKISMKAYLGKINPFRVYELPFVYMISAEVVYQILNTRVMNPYNGVIFQQSL